MFIARRTVLAIALALGGCATDAGLEDQRTVFTNPLGPPEVDRRGIGPQCDVDFGRDATCLGTPLIYPGRGRHVLLGNGETIRLTRAQRRILRERGELLERPRTPAPPPPPPPPEPDPAPAGEHEAP
ncbi:MAG: hypothetical protein V2I74_00100 [Erythrobacter sp.]|jgi:hypothetical protein|nr:hypothetical protein [Erythrobacter sp.]